ncbi:hypothetical protein M431DRAFT_410682 [Trichoderma harzianum CBS 226.95]|uniref:Uncharacterized protein n=1 Tax=Trichoderma harzianum CBS 226.95 TaxID=983964 RepID=A0A2T4AG17_TRIHA|nr:hypothetical protein M431DRAFT_410682 [Trichoderma harzianum CBS 226.95]PTB55858.1 hypothetical protein M431DRAFT_410682 [Trichoderma harzianum CBS 226.95]
MLELITCPLLRCLSRAQTITSATKCQVHAEAFDPFTSSHLHTRPPSLFLLSYSPHKSSVVSFCLCTPLFSHVGSFRYKFVCQASHRPPRLHTRPPSEGLVLDPTSRDCSIAGLLGNLVSNTWL